MERESITFRHSFDTTEYFMLYIFNMYLYTTYIYIYSRCMHPRYRYINTLVCGGGGVTYVSKMCLYVLYP